MFMFTYVLDVTIFPYMADGDANKRSVQKSQEVGASTRVCSSKMLEIHVHVHMYLEWVKGGRGIV